AGTRVGNAERADAVRLRGQRGRLVDLSVDLFAVLAVGRAIHGGVLELDHLRAAGTPDLSDADDGHITSPDLLPARDPPGIDVLQLILGDVGDWVVAMDEHGNRVVADDLVVQAPPLLSQG